MTFQEASDVPQPFYPLKLFFDIAEESFVRRDEDGRLFLGQSQVTRIIS